MSKSNKQTNALQIIAKAQMSTTGGHLDDVTEQCIHELKMISSMEGAAALRALRFGLVMHQAKALVPHGGFITWQKTTFEGKSRAQCNYYMQLALVFIASMRLNAVEVLKLPNAQLDLALADQEDTTRRVLEKAAKFIGETSLNELLIKHGIKGVGLKKALEAAKAKEEGEPAAPDAEQLYLQYRDEAGGVIQRAESLFLQEGCLAHLIGHPEELQGIANGLRSLADKVETQVKDLLSQQPEASDQTPESDAATLAEIS